MDIDSYTTECEKFCVYPSFSARNIDEFYYLAGLLAEEVGEVLSIVNKACRSGQRTLIPGQEEQLDKELGDCFWALCQLCRANGMSPSLIIDQNLTKLEDRMNRNVIDGSGDNR